MYDKTVLARRSSSCNRTYDSSLGCMALFETGNRFDIASISTYEDAKLHLFCQDLHIQMHRSRPRGRRMAQNDAGQDG